MTKTSQLWDNINEGDEIPSITKSPTAMQLFMFSAVTWNRHLIHYNKEYAQHDGLEDVAVHRALLGNFLAQLLTDWLGDTGRITKIEWSVRASAKPGDALTCSGKVLEKRIEDGKQLIDTEIRIENDHGTLIAPGKATVTIFN